MFRETPEQRLLLAKQHHARLIHEAEQNRLAAADSDESVDHLTIRTIARAVAWLGRPLATLKRTFSVLDAPCSDPCHDAAS